MMEVRSGFENVVLPNPFFFLIVKLTLDENPKDGLWVEKDIVYLVSWTLPFGQKEDKVVTTLVELLLYYGKRKKEKKKERNKSSLIFGHVGT